MRNLAVFCFLLLLVGCISPGKREVSSSPADTAEESVEEPVSNVTEMPDLSTRGAIAVLPFVTEGLQQRTSSTGFSSALLAELKARTQFQFIERANLDSITDELSNSQSGLVDSDSIARIGRLVGAKYLILGEMNDSQFQKSVTARVVHVETGSIITAARRSGTEDQVIDHLAGVISNQLSIYMAMENPESPYTVALKLPDNRSTFQFGETMQLKFKVISHSETARSSVYIQIYSIDAKGKMTLIYPNRFSGQEPVEVDKEYLIPSNESDWEWVLVPPAGNEFIQAIVTEQSVDYLNVLSRARSSFPVSNLNGNSSVTYKGIVTRIKKEKLNDWSSGRIGYELIEPEGN